MEHGGNRIDKGLDRLALLLYRIFNHTADLCLQGSHNKAILQNDTELACSEICNDEGKDLSEGNEYDVNESLFIASVDRDRNKQKQDQI